MQLFLPIVLLAAAYCQATPILPEEAKNHVGEDVSVRGRVEQVSFCQNGHAFLKLRRAIPEEVFTGCVPAQSVTAVGGQKFLESLAGSPVTISGAIELYKGRPGNRDFIASADCEAVRLTLRREAILTRALTDCNPWSQCFFYKTIPLQRTL